MWAKTTKVGVIEREFKDIMSCVNTNALFVTTSRNINNVCVCV